MELVELNVDDLRLDPNNSNINDVPSIAEAVQEFGNHRVIVVQKMSDDGQANTVGVGNGLVKSLRALGIDKVWGFVVDEDDATFRRRGISDNAVGRKAKTNDQLLAEQLEAMGDGAKLPGVDDAMRRRLHDLLHPEPKPDDPIFPVNPDPGERYDYVLVVAKTPVDVAWLENVVGMPRRKSYKNTQVGRGHVILVSDLQKKIEGQVEVAVQLKDAGRGQ